VSKSWGAGDRKAADDARPAADDAATLQIPKLTVTDGGGARKPASTSTRITVVRGPVAARPDALLDALAVPAAWFGPPGPVEAGMSTRITVPFEGVPPRSLPSAPPDVSPLADNVAEEPAEEIHRWTGRRAGSSVRRGSWEAHYVQLLVVLDLLAALAAGVIAFATRFGEEVTAYNQGYLLVTGLLPALFVLSLGLNRTYERRYLFVGSDEYQRVLRGGAFLTAGIALMSYSFAADLARGYMVLALPTATVLSLAARFALRKRLHRLRARGSCLRRVIVVGHELAVVAMARQLGREPYHGFEVGGCCLPRVHDNDVGMAVFGTFDDVAGAVRRSRADTVLVLSCPELDGLLLRRLAWQLERDDIDLIVASSLVDVAGSRTTVRPVDGLPMLHVEHPRLSGIGRIAKSIFDRCGAAFGLIVLLPLLLALAVAINLDSDGPVLFRQVRVGRAGRRFVMYKFRTMVIDAERQRSHMADRNELDGVLFKVREDPRITRVGRWMRRYSLDELPQLINVLRGEMSLVGPRPPLPEEVAKYPFDMRRRLVVNPGLTGLWQVSGRSDLSWEETVRLDLRYVENWSFSLDLVILLRTLSAVCRSSGAY
jgi:exopolysaccharide biosynthesis polyprenyl glycosylphosphotransferase